MPGTKMKTEKEKVKCKHCGYSFTLFMSHLKKKIDCQKAYGKGYERMLELNKQKKKDYIKGYKVQHKDTINENQRERRNENREEINKKPTGIRRK